MRIIVYNFVVGVIHMNEMRTGTQVSRICLHACIYAEVTFLLRLKGWFIAEQQQKNHSKKYICMYTQRVQTKH